MKVKTTTLKSRALDWAVGQCVPKHDVVLMMVGGRVEVGFHTTDDEGNPCLESYSPTTDWALGGPLAEEFHIDVASVLWDTVDKGPVRRFQATRHAGPDRNLPVVARVTGTTELEARLLCLVLSVKGDTLDIPDELIHGS